MRRRSFRSEIGSDRGFQALPNSSDPVELVLLVEQLKGGCPRARSRLIELHIKLVASIAGQRVPAEQVDDAIQEAEVALVEAVDDAVTRLHDNNITPYITTCVKHKLKEFRARDRLVAMPGRTFRHKVSKGEIKPGDNTDAVVVGVVSTMRLVKSEHVDSDDVENHLHVGHYMPGYDVPEAKPVGPSYEFTEALRLAVVSPQEQAYVEMRSEGYNNREIGERYNKTPARVGQVIHDVEIRFDQYMTA
jgi:hypothetical protein